MLMNPIIDLVEAHGRLGAPQIRRIRRLDSEQIERVCEAMKAQLHQGVRLSTVASLVGFSASQFSRSFHASIGVTFTAFLLRLRIEAAMRLMTETELPLSEVALASGFGDQSNFSRSFARAVGLTPLKWRTLNHE